MANTEKISLVKAVVARGRTVHAQAEKFAEGGEPILYGEGRTVELPVDEVERLRKLGFLKPAVEPELDRDGPSITAGQVAITKTS